MNQLKNILKRLAVRLPYRMRRWVLSGMFGLIVIAGFYLLRWLIPPGRYSDELITVLFIALSVLVLFPARDRISQRLLQRREYAALFGGDFHHLDVLAGNYTVQSLVHEVTPDLLDWLQVRTGTIAILQPAGGVFHMHPVSNLRTTGSDSPEGQTLAVHEIEEMRLYLKKRRSAVFKDELELPAFTRTFLKKHSAQVLVPFVYRSRLLGFLLLHEGPRHKYTAIGLETYAGKASVSIQNYVLSVRLLDGGMMRYEKMVAERIQKILQFTTVPRIPGLQVRLLKRRNDPYIVEFFRAPDESDRWYVALLCAPRSTGSSALLLFGMLGYLYSYIHREQQFSLQKLIAHLKQDTGTGRTQHRLEIFAAELNVAEQTMVAVVDGADLDIRDLDQPDQRLISPGWRNYLDLEHNRTLRISYGNEALLEICARPRRKRNNDGSGGTDGTDGNADDKTNDRGAARS